MAYAANDFHFSLAHYAGAVDADYRSIYGYRYGRLIGY